MKSRIDREDLLGKILASINPVRSSLASKRKDFFLAFGDSIYYMSRCYFLKGIGVRYVYSAASSNLYISYC